MEDMALCVSSVILVLIKAAAEDQDVETLRAADASEGGVHCR